MTRNPANLQDNLQDIQGLAMRGYGDLAFGGYLFFKISSVSDFKTWLKSALETQTITAADIKKNPDDTAAALSMTSSGLSLLTQGLLSTDSLPAEFVEGMVSEHRSRLLGDLNLNAPENWRWGKDNEIDGLLVVAAAEANKVNNLLDNFATPKHGVTELARIKADLPEDQREPFGFKDGISQPIIAGTKRETKINGSRDHKLNAVATGEFILGYADGSEKLPRSPAISPAADPHGFLPSHHERPELRDFGRNGSFLVVRQLAQDVDAFKAFVAKNTTDTLDVGAKMVGRTTEGATLTEDPQATGDNDFDYIHDLKGTHCPIGSHVRRTNPRSTVHAGSQDGSLKVTNRHRIIRRGRIYKNQDGETGLVFVCLNASINRQFEFIQSTWSNDPFFQGLTREVDPILGTQRKNAQGYSIPAKPYRLKIPSVPQWVTVKGGGYFFLPSLSALNVMAEL
ncbi:MAG: Dyp-type peroxidase [Pseudomonadales bacterium]|nr:Dyp-type peroxidase [Pseudomonadales bacterium]